jgi:hypothetical protein
MEFFMAQDRIDEAISKWGDRPSISAISEASEPQLCRSLRERPHWRAMDCVPIFAAQKTTQ